MDEYKKLETFEFSSKFRFFPKKNAQIFKAQIKNKLRTFIHSSMINEMFYYYKMMYY